MALITLALKLPVYQDLQVVTYMAVRRRHPDQCLLVVDHLSRLAVTLTMVRILE